MEENTKQVTPEAEATNQSSEIPPYGKRLVEHVVDYDRDIKPYHVTLLVAGVGAGKTRFLAKMARDGLNVLEITSRRAIADEQRASLDAIPTVKDIKKFIGSKKICVLTNAQVEQFYKHSYNEDEPETQIWNYFDVICLDEAHSLVTDATFADSGFYVQLFLKTAIKSGCNCHFMFATGTPEPIEYLFKPDNNELFDSRTTTFKKIDCFKECKHVMPKRVVTIDRDSAYVVMKKLLENGDKVIYFSRTIDNIVEILKRLKKDDVIDMKAVGVDYSDNERNSDFSKDEVERRRRIRDSLAIERRLPDDIQLFLSTTKNKEGINIENEDIHYMFGESNLHSELRQMSGRLRAFDGYECFFIVYDQYWKQQMAEGMFTIELERSLFENDKKSGLDSYIRYKIFASKYSDYSTVHSFQSPVLKQKEIESHLFMIRYLPHTNKLVWFKAREESFKLSINNSFELHDYIDHWDEANWGMVKDVDEYGTELDTEHLVNFCNPDYFTCLERCRSEFKWYRDKPNEVFEEERKKLATLESKATRKLTGMECLGLWFPGASIEKGLSLPKTPDEVLQIFAEQFYYTIDKLGIELNDKYDKEKFDELTNEINELLKHFDYSLLDIKTYPVKSLNPVLKILGLKLEQPSHAVKQYRLTRVDYKLPEDEGGYDPDDEEEGEEIDGEEDDRE